MTANVITLAVAIIVAATLLGGIFQAVPVANVTGPYNNVAVLNRFNGGVYFCSAAANKY